MRGFFSFILPNLMSCMRTCLSVPKHLNSRGITKCLSSKAEALKHNLQSGGKSSLTSKMGSILLNVPWTVWYSYSPSNSILGETNKTMEEITATFWVMLFFFFFSPPGESLESGILGGKKKKKKGKGKIQVGLLPAFLLSHFIGHFKVTYSIYQSNNLNFSLQTLPSYCPTCALILPLTYSFLFHEAAPSFFGHYC